MANADRSAEQFRKMTETPIPKLILSLVAVFIKQLGHAQFLANDTFLHLCKSSCKGYWLAAGCPPT